jgi:hypothetical protein
MSVRPIEPGPRLTPDDPDIGAFGSHGIVLTAAQRWIEDDIHVIRSLEFDVWGEGPSLKDAEKDFGDCFRAFYFHLVELASEGSATEDELQLKTLLTKRLSDVIAIHDRELQRKLDWPWRRGRQHSSGWRPSTQVSSQLVSVR